MVAGSPRIDSVLPAFLEFARDAVLVAHNAPFDIGFLKAAAARTGHEWPRFQVVDTAHLARQSYRDEAPNRKLSTLAQLFGAATTPDHRALHDARATVDVLHGLLARVGNLGVDTLEELTTFSSRVTSAQRRKRYLAEALPSAPGVYLFKDRQGRVLYVGTSRDIRRRVRSITASEQRTRMAEMVGIAESVTPVVCHTTLEAEVASAPIAEHKPRYNRRSRHPERALSVKLTVEAFPRLSIVREVRDDGTRYVGPFSLPAVGRVGDRGDARGGPAAAVHQEAVAAGAVLRLRTGARWAAAAHRAPGRRSGVEDYASVVADAAAVLGGDARGVVSALHQRMSLLAGQERFEDAGAVRDRMLAPGPRRGARAAAGTARGITGGRGRPPQRRRRLGGRVRPVRPAGRDDDKPPGSEPDAVSSPP